MKKPVVILGVDPGTLILGYSVVEIMGTSFTVKEMDVLKLSSNLDHYERLQRIYDRITNVIQNFEPQQFAIEAPFFGKNVQSMLKLGRAQGVAIAAAMSRGLIVAEYSPRKIKQSITGNGNADKEQVWQMLQRITGLPDKPKYFDATDALAVALCHHFGNKFPVVPATKSGSKKKSTKSDWEKFAKANPNRLG